MSDRSRTYWVGAAVAGLVFATWYISLTPAIASPESTDAADFPNYYFGGERLLDGRPVYDQLDEEMANNFGVEGYDTYPADPPPTVVLMAPLSLLSYTAAWYVWSVISMALLLASMWLVTREIGLAPPLSAVLCAVMLLSSPARFMFTRNHVETVVVFFAVLGWRALRNRDTTRASGFFAIATAVKLFPGMFLLGVVRRDLRRGVAGLAAAGALVALGMVTIGWDNTHTFLTDVIQRSRIWYGSLGNYSLVSVGTAVVDVWFGWVLAAIGAAILLPVYLRTPRHADQLFVMGGTTALLLSPLAWLNYLVLAGPMLLIVGAKADLRVPGQRIRLGVLVVVLLFWAPMAFESELLSHLLSFLPAAALVALFVLALREPAWASAPEEREAT